MKRRIVDDVVVGVDEHPSSLAALDWATAEAAARGAELRIVHARYCPVPPDPYGIVVPVDEICAAREAGERVLRAAVRRVRDIASDVPVSAHLATGIAAQVLLDWSRDAALLVVGVAGPEQRRHRIPRPRLINWASCPVAIIRDRQAPQRARTSPRVVLGVDGSGRATPAIHAAFQAAAQRQVPLLVVHAHKPPDPPAYTEAWSITASGSVERALQAGRAAFPDVPVTIAIDTVSPVEALSTGAAGAALVVVGSNLHRGIPILNCQPISHALLEHIAAPVLVVPRRAGRRHPSQRPDQVGRADVGRADVERADNATRETPPTHRRAKDHHRFSGGPSQ
ncbi:universal stress protein [Pseudonocardia sp. NPDC049154]|uniref:universal stress protein n=1 Tax=Pseudonocardia sp. NPDC049154 TaxID=3155501 RepID=UPI0033C05F78